MHNLSIPPTPVQAALVTSALPLDPKLLDEVAERAVAELVAAGRSANTDRSYRSALRYWAAWFFARYRQLIALPVSEATVLQFIVDHAERGASGVDAGPSALPVEIDHALVRAGFKARPGAPALSTLIHRVSVLSKAHGARDMANPCQSPPVRELLASTRRSYARRGKTTGRKPALTLQPLEAVLATCDDSLRGKRDRALLLFAWASGGRRRSEVSAACHEQLQRDGDAYVFDLRLSKTNQDGEELPENMKPVDGPAAKALTEWIVASGVRSGPIFRRIRKGDRVAGGLSDSAVRDIVKTRCRLAGLDAKFSAHSLRSGFVTEAGRQGASLADVMAMTGHRTTSSVLKYQRARAALDNPAARLMPGDKEKP